MYMSRIGVVIGSWGGSWGPTGPPLLPLTTTLKNDPLGKVKMTPKCRRIDVKYANCSYHTRIGLGKWTHNPTLALIVALLPKSSRLILR